jgi:site-specific recombinase XerD
MKNASTAQFQGLLGAVNRRSPFGERDYQMLRLMASTGLRVAELVSLDVADVWREGQAVSVLFVRAAIAKGGHSRSVPLCQTAREAVAGLVAFLSRRGFSTAPEAPLLVVRQHRRISIRLVQQIVQQLREHAGLEVPATPHSMSHFFATQLVERTQDVVATSRLLGHRDVQTTMIYAASSPQRLAEVVASLDA